MKVRIRLLGALAMTIALSTTPLDAQTALAPKEFGTQDESITIIGSASFVSEEGFHSGSAGLRWDTGGFYLEAPLNMLPNGSKITKIVYFFRDEYPNTNLDFLFSDHTINASSGEQVGFDFSVAPPYPTGDSGDTYVIDATEHDIQYRTGPDSVGNVLLHDYALFVSTPAGDISTSISAVQVYWRRQISPAPSIATFGDVPTNHQFFQFIEALSDSGITAGCQANPPLFCPDRTLTRGEMAVFLAKALGLHWPWDAP